MSYRGGDGGMSSFGAEATKAIANGQTEGQRSRDFRNKAMMAAIRKEKVVNDFAS